MGLTLSLLGEKITLSEKLRSYSILPRDFDREFGLFMMKAYFHSVIKKYIPAHSVTNAFQNCICLE